MTRARPQAGFSLIELMVAMVLGLVLTIVIGQVFLGAKESYRTTEDLGRLQENARFAVTQLSRVIRLTSYVTYLPVGSPLAFDPVAARTLAFPAGAMTGTEGSGTAPDSITVRYQGSGSPAADGSILDCQGNSIAGSTLAVAKFYISTGANNANALFCDNTGTVGPASPGPIELASDVENMQVLYGVDTDADGTANKYVGVSSVGTFDNVVSVRIGLLVRTSSEVASQANTSAYNLVGTGITAPGDRRVRRSYTTTIALRNRTP
jgi:type IV pilus assembly protein PilW